MIRIEYIVIILFIFIGIYIFIPVFELKLIFFIISIAGLLLLPVYIIGYYEFNEVD